MVDISASGASVEIRLGGSTFLLTEFDLGAPIRVDPRQNATVRFSVNAEPVRIGRLSTTSVEVAVLPTSESGAAVLEMAGMQTDTNAEPVVLVISSPLYSRTFDNGHVVAVADAPSINADGAFGPLAIRFEFAERGPR